MNRLAMEVHIGANMENIHKRLGHKHAKKHQERINGEDPLNPQASQEFLDFRVEVPCSSNEWDIIFYSTFQTIFRAS